jgi:hypothetical protein
MNDKAMIFSLSMRAPARRVANIQHTMRYTELTPDLLRDIWRD